jgi:hypothetical protein
MYIQKCYQSWQMRCKEEEKEEKASSATNLGLRAL